VAEFPADARDLKGLIQKADEALYLAKDRGRNRIEPYSHPDPRPSRETSWTRVL
jgi:PleD family two-component response regulator